MTAEPERILVTGGAGFIGSALVWALNQRGITDIVVTDFKSGEDKLRNLAGLKFTELVEAGAFRSRIAGQAGAHGRFSHVFHLGACSSTTETNEAYLLDNNFNVSRELAAWSLARGSHFIYASSAATYGDGANGMSDRDDPEKFRPLNAYARSKQKFDLHALKNGWLDHIIGLKYFNVFGPNEDHKGEMRSLVNKAFGEIIRTGKLSLFRSHRPDYGDGEQKRDFLYVKDAVEMTIYLGFAPGVPGGIYNLGSGEANTWNTLAGAIFAAMESKPVIEYVEMPEILRGKYQYFTRADITKLRAAGYGRPLVPLWEAIGDYVRNYLVPQRRLGE